MNPTFDADKLFSLLKDFYTLTRIRITVFDDKFNELVAYPENRCAFCQIIRSDPAANAMCNESDKKGCVTALERRKPYTYRCHAGLTESLTPLYMGNIIIGYLFFGQIFSYPSNQEGWESVRQHCSSYHVDFSLLREICLEREIMSKDYITAASHLMQAVASWLCLEQMAMLKHDDLPARIDSYISAHYTEDINAAHLCDTFHIGKTPLYEMSKQAYGCGIAEHIRNLRIQKACRLLLENPDMRIGEVASRCGYSDYNYFITVFKRVTGVSPRQYRKNADNLHF